MQKLRKILYLETGIGDPKFKRYRRKHYAWTYIVLTLSALAISLMQLMLAVGDFHYPMLFSYFEKPLIAALNIAPVLLLMYGMWFIFDRAWLAVLVTGALMLGASVGNWYKLALRDDPFTFADIKNIGAALDISSRYTLEFNWKILAAAALLILLTLFSLFFARARHRKAPWLRILGVVISFGILAGACCTVYQSSKVYNATKNNELINKWSGTQKFISRGFVYPFIHSAEDAVLPKPEGYDEAAVKELLGAYGEGELTGEKVNIIGIMLEAYCDLSEFDVGVDEACYQNLHLLESEGISGKLHTSIFAGGTVETEWMFLTGFEHASAYSYRSALDSYVRWFNDNGYATMGGHPGYAWFYNRRNVYEYFGFEETYFNEDHYAELYPWSVIVPDGVFFDEVLRLCGEKSGSGDPYFSFNVTYQNHGPYDDASSPETSRITNAGLSESGYNIANNYLNGVFATDEALGALREKLIESDEPTVIVIFGDHKPWFGEGNSVFKELGINIDLGTDEGNDNYYSTPYVIWANDAAKEVTGSSFEGEGEDFSPNFLMNRLFRELGWTGDAFMQLTDELYEEGVSVINNTGWFIQDGERVDELTGRAAELYDELKWAQYYRIKHAG